MKRIACRYSIVRFLPYQETGEFVNVGIVLACPETGYFDFKLQTSRYSRITNFFVELESKVYLESIKLFRSELARIKSHANDRQLGAEDIREFFSALTHPREAIIQLTEARPRLSESPKQTLNQLFEYYVERSFSTPEYRETVVERKVKALVDSLPLKRPFKAATLGDEFVTARFPLAQYEKDRIGKVIKPFALNHDEPYKIIQHGASWLDRIKRLDKKGLLPPHVLFAVEGPPSTAENRTAAFNEICEELGEVATVVSSKDKEQIAEFALED